MQFENHYMKAFCDAGRKYKDSNLRRIYQRHFANSPSRDQIISRLREYDIYVNVLWPLAHIKSAARYLKNDPEVLKATGGTNWQKYLPPRFQKRMFFPELWNEDEVRDWGIAAFKREAMG